MTKGGRHKNFKHKNTKPMRLDDKPRKISEDDVNFETAKKEVKRLQDIYYISERELKRYVREAVESPQDTSVDLLRQLVFRLDSMVYHLGFAPSVQTAQELIIRGYIFVNNVVRDDPSFHIGQRDTITCKVTPEFNNITTTNSSHIPPWLERQGMSGYIKHIPTANELHLPDIDVEKVINYFAII